MAGGKVECVEVVGVASAVPNTVETIDDLGKSLGEDRIQRIAKSVGVVQRHVSAGKMCASDLCFFAAEKLLADLRWEKSSIDLLVFVSITPDFQTPATSCMLQHRLGLSKDCAAFDITHACSGYIYGLWIVAQLLSGGTTKRALLLIGDTASCLASPYDRTTAPLFGDAGSATALQWNPGALPMYFELGSDGGGAEHLLVKAGGSRHPSTAETLSRTEREDGNVRNDQELYMDGGEVFAFTLREVPRLHDKVLRLAHWTIDDVDAVVMHQANLFMLQHLATKLRIPKGKFVENLSHFGNTGGSTIPLAMTSKLGEQLSQRSMRLTLLGFGSGLSWGGAALTCGPLIVPSLTVVHEHDLARHHQ
jgi:3-oxoacyl-[acyl-carrier-protein] synthase-3